MESVYGTSGIVHNSALTGVAEAAVFGGPRDVEVLVRPMGLNGPRGV